MYIIQIVLGLTLLAIFAFGMAVYRAAQRGPRNDEHPRPRPPRR